MSDKLFYSYTLPRKFKDMNIPINIQSCFLRDYCVKNRFRYVLPQTEIINDGSIYILRGLISKISARKNLIGMTSIFMLPYHDKEQIKVIQQLDSLNNIEWHFPLESTVCGTKQLLDLTAEHTRLEWSASKSGAVIYRDIFAKGASEGNTSTD